MGTALEMVDEDGAEALTLRSLATRLRSSTATLYRHFSGRAELTRAVVDALFAEVDLDEDVLAHATWDAALRHIAEAMFKVLEGHRNVSPLLLSELPTGPHALRLRERSLAVLTANGFDPVDAVRTYATLARYVLGFGVQVPGEDAAGARPEGERSRQAGLVGSVDLGEEFRYGLDLMLDGLRGRRRASPDAGR
ncbi:TetR/AcrR family transcriptional regulator C-terminal domain-containing protein [Nocardioides sp. YIM 152588]|uniref:TetR/AcrR family transcriptional regulator n=1 Tax=Nocardioides sp. YIM 152588 TaxID=3158259 RepID=UPI0032E409BA